MICIGIGSKFKGLLHRKSIDERVEEAFSSTGRESFSKRVWEANIQAQQKLRETVPAAAKTLVKRPEERYNPYYPGVYDAPYGNPHEEGPLTKNFDVTPAKNDFGRFDEDSLNQTVTQNNIAEVESTLPHERAQPKLPETVSTPQVTLPVNENIGTNDLKKKSEGLMSLSDLREVMEELREIREQNAVILEKLRAIERKLTRH